LNMYIFCYILYHYICLPNTFHLMTNENQWQLRASPTARRKRTSDV
jgi:hypothetical protein